VTDLLDPPASMAAKLVVPGALVALGLLTWLDWSRREPRLKARTADRLR
jgi:hypothetical protein